MFGGALFLEIIGVIHDGSSSLFGCIRRVAAASRICHARVIDTLHTGKADAEGGSNDGYLVVQCPELRGTACLCNLESECYKAGTSCACHCKERPSPLVLSPDDDDPSAKLPAKLALSSFSAAILPEIGIYSCRSGQDIMESMYCACGAQGKHCCACRTPRSAGDTCTTKSTSSWRNRTVPCLWWSPLDKLAMCSIIFRLAVDVCLLS